MALSTEVINFITVTIDELTLPLIVRAFELIDLSQKEGFQTKYQDLIDNLDNVDPFVIPDLIRDYVVEDLLSIIELHDITVNDEFKEEIATLNGIVDILYRVQTLEDYTQVGLITNSSHPNDYKFALLGNYLTDIEVIVLLKTIDEVNDGFFELLNNFIDEKELTVNDESLRVCSTESTVFLQYMDMIKGTPSIAQYYFERGFGLMLTVEEMFAIPVEDIKGTLHRIAKDEVELAFNILSILMMCCDSRNTPVSFFKENSSMFLYDVQQSGRVYHLIERMYSDFKQHLKTLGEQHENYE